MSLSRIVCIYSNMVSVVIDPFINNMIAGGVSTYQPIIINAKYIQSIIGGFDGDFLDFPVQKILINLNIKYQKIEKRYRNNFKTEGAMYPYGKKKDGGSYVTKKYDINFSKSIINELSMVSELVMDLGLIIDDKRFVDSDLNSLKIEMMSLIMHELLHGYEFWMRYNNKKDDTVKVALSFMSIKDGLFTKKVNGKVNRFLYYIYWTLPHEQNATVHELYPYVLKYSVDELKTLPQFCNLVEMSEFKSDNFYNELLNLIPKKNRKSVLKKLYNEFIRNYKKVHKFSDEDINDDIINKKSFKDILNYYEKTIMLGGENMRKKVLKLYSYKAQFI